MYFKKPVLGNLIFKTMYCRPCVWNCWPCNAGVHASFWGVLLAFCLWGLYDPQFYIRALCLGVYGTLYVCGFLPYMPHNFRLGAVDLGVVFGEVVSQATF